MTPELLTRETLAALIARAGLKSLSQKHMDEMLETYALLQEMLPHARPVGGYEAEPSAVFSVASPAIGGSL
jgi:hypothetical protein